MQMILLENNIFLRFKSNKKMLSVLAEKFFFLKRIGMAGPSKVQECRWKNGDVIEVQKGCTVEPFATVVEGNRVFCVGSFSSVDYTIVGGVPAKVIKQRFDPELAKEQNGLKWWEYKLADLYALGLESPEAFIKKFHKHQASLRVYKPEVTNYADLFRRFC